VLACCPNKRIYMRQAPTHNKEGSLSCSQYYIMSPQASAHGHGNGLLLSQLYINIYAIYTHKDRHAPRKGAFRVPNKTNCMRAYLPRTKKGSLNTLPIIHLHLRYIYHQKPGLNQLLCVSGPGSCISNNRFKRTGF
jgi:hypothetical protein